MMRAYFDDSGTHTGSRVMVMGGLCGTVAQWDEFEQAWAAKLAEPLPGKPPLRKFHLSECNAGRGQFEGYSEAEQDAATHDFRQILIGAKLRSVAYAIDRLAWDELVIGVHRERLGADPLHYCAEYCTLWALSQAQDDHPDWAASVMFDEGVYTPALAALLEPMGRPQMRPRITLIRGGAVDLVLPLQGADIVATENYWHMGEALKLGGDAEPRAHMRHYLRNMVHEGLILDREALEAMLVSPEYLEAYA